jgi:class 3 adenylate cyclase
MSGTDPYAETLLANGSDVGESLSLPTGMVTLLLADIEGSTRLWDTQPEATAAALELLDRTVADIVAAFRGLPPTGRQVPRCGFPVGVDVVTGLLQPTRHCCFFNALGRGYSMTSSAARTIASVSMPWYLYTS